MKIVKEKTLSIPIGAIFGLDVYEISKILCFSHRYENGHHFIEIHSLVEYEDTKKYREFIMLPKPDTALTILSSVVPSNKTLVPISNFECSCFFLFHVCKQRPSPD